MTTYWAYNILVWEGGLDSLSEKLDELGHQGWEAYQILYASKGLLGTYTVFLKRCS